jgi:hypothetical protein
VKGLRHDAPTIRGVSDDEPETPKPKSRRKRKTSVAQTMGGVLFGFEQQVWRTAPPPQELVHHARPDAAVPAGDGTLVTIELPATLDESTDDEEPTR